MSGNWNVENRHFLDLHDLIFLCIFFIIIFIETFCFMSAATAIGTSIHLKYLRFHVVILSNFFCARTWFPFFMILQLYITGDLMFLLWKSFKGRCDSHESHLPLFRTIYFPIAPYKPPPAAACFLSISFHIGKYMFLPDRQNGWPLPAPINTANVHESQK